MKQHISLVLMLVASLVMSLVGVMVVGGEFDTFASVTGWVERRPAGDIDREWQAIASDSSGTVLVACNSGDVYTSRDGGVTWASRTPYTGGLSQDWVAVASDSDGSNLIVASWSGLLLTSSNSGVNWISSKPSGKTDQRWQTVASDADGSSLIAGASAGRLWVTSDGGASWVETRPTGNTAGDWRGASSDSDGSVLLVANYGGRLYCSTSGGDSWSELTPAGAGDREWLGTACDSDGSHLITGVFGGRLYTSPNSGTTWTERRPAGDTDRNWSRFASDSDGSALLAADGARLYLSRDSGATWKEQQPAGDKDVRWTCCSNSDGSYLVAGGYAGGRLYTLGVNSGARTLAVAKVGSGTVTLDPVGGTYGDGTIVTLAAAPSAGYTFGGWSGDLSGTANPVSITMDADKAVTATFTALPTYTLTPSAETGGGITPGTVQTVLRGGSKAFTVSPNAGYQIADVSVDGVSQGAISSYTFTNVMSNHTISARFDKETRQTVIVLQIGRSTFTVNGISKTLDSPPVIANGRTLVPIRAIIEALGGAVEWDGTARKATVTLGDVTIELWIGKSVARVNNTSTRIDSTNPKVVPEIINGRTMLPLRFVSENLGCVVEWADATRTITITYAP